VTMEATNIGALRADFAYVVEAARLEDDLLSVICGGTQKFICGSETFRPASPRFA
jgi:hypothetical protein